MTQIQIPFPPDIVWPALALLAIGFGIWATYALLPRAGMRTPWLDRLRAAMGLEALDGGLFALGLTLYAGLCATLLAGLATLLWQTVAWTLQDLARTAEADRAQAFLFYVLRIAGLTTVLAAVVAFPIQIMRLRLTNQQTRTAEAALFNDKVNAALEDLYSRRRVTQWHRKDGYVDHWEDDITRRNAAINRLERLADDPNGNPEDIARMLAIYIRELSKENPPEPAPDTDDIATIRKWASSLEPKRTDIQNAAQTLGRLSGSESIRARGYDISGLPLDLRGTNLQGCDLNGLNFEQALFREARMEGADLCGANLDRADLDGAKLDGANLFGTQLTGADLFGAQMKGADLSEAQMKVAELRGAQMEGANLSWAQVKGADLSEAQMEGVDLFGVRFSSETNLTNTNFRGAAVRSVDFTNVPQIADHLDDLFGDASVSLPEEVTAPDHWDKETLDWKDFRTAWRAFQRAIGQDPGDP